MSRNQPHGCGDRASSLSQPKRIPGSFGRVQKFHSANLLYWPTGALRTAQLVIGLRPENLPQGFRFSCSRGSDMRKGDVV
jgi:hypothetical protein